MGGAFSSIMFVVSFSLPHMRVPKNSAALFALSGNGTCLPFLSFMLRGTAVKALRRYLNPKNWSLMSTDFEIISAVCCLLSFLADLATTFLISLSYVSIVPSLIFPYTSCSE